MRRLSRVSSRNPRDARNKPPKTDGHTKSAGAYYQGAETVRLTSIVPQRSNDEIKAIGGCHLGRISGRDEVENESLSRELCYV